MSRFWWRGESFGLIVVLMSAGVSVQANSGINSGPRKDNLFHGGHREQPSHASLPRHGHHCLPRWGQGCAEGSCVSLVMSVQRNLHFLWLCEGERLLHPSCFSTLWKELSREKEKSQNPDRLKKNPTKLERLWLVSVQSPGRSRAHQQAELW